jgi:hypothetical protein
MVVALAFILAIFKGSLLSAWMFVNSLQLIAHLPLIQTGLPANVHTYLIKLLSLVRFDIAPLRLYISGLFGGNSRWTMSTDFNLIEEGKYVAYNTALNNAGYSFSMVNNMFTVIVLAGLLTMAWTLLCAFEAKFMPETRRSKATREAGT